MKPQVTQKQLNIVVREIVGKRLTWDQLTGKTSDSTVLI